MFYNVLHILGSLNIGGPQIALLNLLKQSDRTAYKHSICTFNGIGFLAPEFEKIGVNIINLQKSRNKKFDWMLIRKLKAHMKDRNVHILRTYNDKSGFYGRIAGKISGVPVIIASFHGRHIYVKKMVALQVRETGE